MKNSKLFIFQHGDGGIFADNDSYNIGWDKRICDKYFVWGKNPKNGYKSFFYTKKYLKKNGRFFSSKGGKILLTMYGFNEQPFRPINGFNDNYETNKGLILNIKVFFSTLSSKIKRDIDIKLSDNSKDKNVKKNLKKNLVKSVIIEDNQDYLKILNNYNLIVHFYLGTPFFESMLFNKPSIIILNKNFQLHFDKNFEIFVNKFLKGKIIFKSAAEAGLFVSKNYYSIEKWWNSKKVQDTRREFCNMYCRHFEPKKDLINLLKI
jgi:putative transferase (TIGR04331 family)